MVEKLVQRIEELAHAHSYGPTRTLIAVARPRK